MKLVCVPGAGRDNFKAFKDYIAAGFLHAMLDFSSFCTPEIIENREDFINLYLEECKKNRIENAIVRSPFCSGEEWQKDLEKSLYALIMESIRVCALAGSKYIIVHPQESDVLGRMDYETRFDWYASLGKELKKAGVMALIPNIPCTSYDKRYKRGFFSDPDELSGFIDELNRREGQELFGVCLDVGNCQLVGQDVFEVVALLQNRIKAVIIRENDGFLNAAWLPFMASGNGKGKQNWTSVIRALRSIEFDGPLVLAFGDTDRAVTHLLRKQLFSFEKSFGDYLVWQISIEKTIRKYPNRVLFGAGNMCKNYMECYGKEYPPMFSCDNNVALWGTQVNGLIIQNPKTLKELPEDCAIFICNIYYREIEQQIREMGIQNPIEYYNDEYLPIVQKDLDFI